MIRKKDVPQDTPYVKCTICGRQKWRHTPDEKRRCEQAAMAQA